MTEEPERHDPRETKRGGEAASPIMDADEDARISPANLGWILGSLLLIVLSIVVYTPILRDGWTRYDNMKLIAAEPMVKDLSIDGVRSMFSNYHHDLYQPLLTLSLAIDHALFGRDPKGHEDAAWPETDLTGWHIHSLAIHLCTVVLLFLLIGRMTGHVLAAWIGTALVALHPLLVEPVSWMICRTFLVAGFWIVLGSHFYLSFARRARWWLYVLSLVCFGLSMLAKLHMGIFLFVLLFDLWCGRRKWGRIIAEKVPLLVLVGVLVAVNSARMFGELRVEPLPDLGMTEMMRRGLVGLCWTAANTFFPRDLAVFYGPSENPWSLFLSRAAVGGFLIVLMWVAAIVALVRRRKELLLCALGWSVLFLPMLAAIRVRETVTADRYNYVALWMLGLGVAWILARWLGAPERSDSGRLGESAVAPKHISGYLPLLLLLVVCGWLMARSRAHARVWSDDVTLWQAVVDRTPHRTGYGQLANALITQARPARKEDDMDRVDELLTRAEGALQAGLELSPDDPTLLENWGVLCLNRANDCKKLRHTQEQAGDTVGAAETAKTQQERLEQARDLYQRAAEVRPASAGAWNGLGVSLMRLGRLAEARGALTESVKLAPQYATALRNLGSVLERIRQAAEADAARTPGADAEQALRVALLAEADHLERMGRTSEADPLRARAIHAEAASADPNDPAALLARGKRALQTAAEKAQLMERLLPRVARVPADQRPRFQAAVDQARSELQTHAEQAEEFYRRLLELDSESSPAWHGMALVHMYRGRNEEATEAFARAVELDRTNAEAVAGWARLTAIKGQFDEAAIMLEKALEIDPGLEAAMLDLSKIYVRQKRYAEAVNLLERLREKRPDDVYARQFLIALYRAMGRQEDAAKLSQKSPSAP